MTSPTLLFSPLPHNKKDWGRDWDIVTWIHFFPLFVRDTTPPRSYVVVLYCRIFCPCSLTKLGILVDSEIVLSTRHGQTRVFINQTLSTQTTYQQDLINRDLLSTRSIVGKVGPGMWCVKFNSTSNVLVCETQRKDSEYVWVCQ
jgi:hypothetical protein